MRGKVLCGPQKTNAASLWAPQYLQVALKVLVRCSGMGVDGGLPPLLAKSSGVAPCDSKDERN